MNHNIEYIINSISHVNLFESKNFVSFGKNKSSHFYKMLIIIYSFFISNKSNFIFLYFCCETVYKTVSLSIL